MERRTSSERDLLFGLLALQTGLIEPGQLFAAFHSWTRDKARTMAEILESQGAVDRSRGKIVDQLVNTHARDGADAPNEASRLPVSAETTEPTASAAEDPFRTETVDRMASPSPECRFQILRQHARGGLGVVFVARDIELNREVALKQILDHHADNPVSRSRFLLEAVVTGGLEHPGIVPVYGLGRFEDGRPYYAMRFIRGDTLKDAVARFHGDGALKHDPGARSLALHKLLRRFLDACNAIDYAHSRGVIHRDLKPSNILVGRHGETLVVDWGLAKAVGRNDDTPTDERTLIPMSASGSSETLPGSTIGTPSFMSPEQALGDLDRVGATSDVYSLGATLYYILTGQPPFQGNVETVLLAVQHGEFTAPRTMDRTISSALEAVCLKAMALKPVDRYQSPRALSEDIERWLADEPVEARPEPLSERGCRQLRRHGMAIGAAAVALIAITVSLGVVLSIQNHAHRQLLEANNREKQSNQELSQAMDRERKTSRALSDSKQREQERFDQVMVAIKVYRRIIENDYLFDMKVFAPLREKLFPEEVKLYSDLAKQLAAEDDARARRRLGLVQFDLAELYLRYGKPAEALAAHQRALEIRRRLNSEMKSDKESQYDLARSLVNVGYCLTLDKRSAEAKALYDEARSLLEGLSRSDPGVARYRFHLARCYEAIEELLSATGQSDDALSVLRIVKDLREALIRQDPTNATYQTGLTRTYEKIGDLLLKLEQPERTREALAIFEKIPPLLELAVRSNPYDAVLKEKLARSHESIATALAKLGQFKEAETARNTATAIRNRSVQLAGIPGESGGAPASGLGGFGTSAPSAFTMIGD